METVVTGHNVKLGIIVKRNPDHWRKKKWKDDGHGFGTVIGYTDETGKLIGVNSDRKYNTDRITHENGFGWCIVRWVNTGKKSVYPIGASNLLSEKWWTKGRACFSLLFTNEQ